MKPPQQANQTRKGGDPMPCVSLRRLPDLLDIIALHARDAAAQAPDGPLAKRFHYSGVYLPILEFLRFWPDQSEEERLALSTLKDAVKQRWHADAAAYRATSLEEPPC
jgi:hypothetical protein